MKWNITTINRTNDTFGTSKKKCTFEMRTTKKIDKISFIDISNNEELPNTFLSLSYSSLALPPFLDLSRISLSNRVIKDGETINLEKYESDLYSYNTVYQDVLTRNNRST